MNRNASFLLRVAAYLGTVVLVACLLSPWLYHLAQMLAQAGIAPFLADFPFHRFFSRTAQVAALVLLWPAFRWVGISRLEELNLRKNPARWHDLGTGIIVAFVPVLLLAACYIWFEVYRFRSSPSPTAWMRILATASVVGVIEEFLFRGVLLGLCLRAMGAAGAACFSSLIFAVVHFLRVAKPEVAVPVEWWSGFAQLTRLFSSAPPWPVLGWGMLSLLAAGLILAFATLRTRSLFLAIGIHAGWIAGQQGLQWLARFRVKPPDALLPWVGPNVVSGAVPTGLVPLGVLGLTALLVAIYLRRRHASDP